MTSTIVPHSCRICFQSGIKLRSMHLVAEDDEESPCRMLEELTGISMENEENLPNIPKKICKSCDLSLNMAYQFRLKAIKAQDMIDEFFQLNKKDIIHIKVEQEEEEEEEEDQENEEENHHEADNDGENLTNEYEEFFEEITLMGHVNKPYTKKDKKLKKRFKNEEKLKEVENYCEENLLDEEDIDIGESYLDENMDEDTGEMKNFVIDYDGDSIESSGTDFQDKSEAKRNPNKKKMVQSKLIDIDEFLDGIDKYSKKSKTTETSHICDICGNIFTHRARMMEHRKRHLADKTHKCEICGEAFNMQEKLRKHMFQHSGQKPYKCSYCSRSFYYKSVKNNHEAVHKGMKPYICNICNRAFAYQHSLGKHKLIHDDIKFYHCSYCNKDFRLLHHYKQHIDTRRHQNCVRIANTAESKKHNDQNPDDSSQDEQKEKLY